MPQDRARMAQDQRKTVGGYGGGATGGKMSPEAKNGLGADLPDFAAFLRGSGEAGFASDREIIRDRNYLLCATR